ncbi:hypothetical protein [Micromonospora endolithica]|uniref:Uncharacterized protein n=1 Tax=Micromonospora endolithica TaxID=230091 RepID=A0A3A9ZI66_9ACTN|nr:hypothetical protein [Micromonospora endolithica]RKN47829.1 hypothetical protein D7223_13895 [Micromonospora endolithica]TWJ21514.1 hypothetical protein JD76_01624 [Micromonospora endolithica]
MRNSVNVWVVIRLAVVLAFVVGVPFAQLFVNATYADNGQITTVVSTAHLADDSPPTPSSGVWCC